MNALGLVRPASSREAATAKATGHIFGKLGVRAIAYNLAILLALFLLTCAAILAGAVILRGIL